MRAKLIGLMLGCGLVAAMVVPAIACPYTQASSDDQKQQQTAQADTSQTKAQ